MKNSHDPSGTAAKQDFPGQMLMQENITAKSLRRNLKDKTQLLKKWVEELDKEVDVAIEVLKKNEQTIQQLEDYSRNLAKINEQLSMETEDLAARISLAQDQKACKVKDINLGTNHEGDSEPETVIACHLRDSASEEFYRNSKWDMKEQFKMLMPQILVLPEETVEKKDIVSTLLEGDEPKPKEDLLIRSQEPKLWNCLWDILKLLLAVVFCFGLCIGLILSYAYLFNNNLIANSLPLLFSDHDIAELIQLLSPYLTWKNNGLLPF